MSNLASCSDRIITLAGEERTECQVPSYDLMAYRQVASHFLPYTLEGLPSRRDIYSERSSLA